MANGLNKVILVGNTCQDAELKYTQGGQAILKLRLAVNTSYADKEGNRKDSVEYTNVLIWGKRGEALSKHIPKGQLLWIEGRLQTRSWEKDGEKRYATEVVATDVGLLGKGKEGGEQRSERGQQSSGGGYTPPDGADYGGDDDGIPFRQRGDVC